MSLVCDSNPICFGISFVRIWFIIINHFTFCVTTSFFQFQILISDVDEIFSQCTKYRNLNSVNGSTKEVIDLELEVLEIQSKAQLVSIF